MFEPEGIKVPLSGYPWLNGTANGQEVELGVRPEHIASIGDLQQPAEAEVELVEPMGAETIVWCRIAGQTLAVRVDGDSTIAAGARLPVSFPIEPGQPLRRQDGFAALIRRAFLLSEEQFFVRSRSRFLPALFGAKISPRSTASSQTLAKLGYEECRALWRPVPESRRA